MGRLGYDWAEATAVANARTAINADFISFTVVSSKKLRLTGWLLQPVCFFAAWLQACRSYSSQGAVAGVNESVEQAPLRSQQRDSLGEPLCIAPRYGRVRDQNAGRHADR